MIAIEVYLVYFNYGTRLIIILECCQHKTQLKKKIIFDELRKILSRKKKLQLKKLLLVFFAKIAFHNI